MEELLGVNVLSTKRLIRNVGVCHSELPEFSKRRQDLLLGLPSLFTNRHLNPLASDKRWEDHFDLATSMYGR